MSHSQFMDVWRACKLQGAELLALLALADQTDDEVGSGVYSLEMLARRARIEESAAEPLLKEFETRGYISLYDPPTQGGVFSYNFLWQDEDDPDTPTGYVYLLRCGEYQKIGRAKNVTRRLTQLAILLPHKPELVHKIETNAPRSLERWFHQRYAAKRLNGEWFSLTEDEVDEFRLWRRMDLRLAAMYDELDRLLPHPQKALPEQSENGQ